MTECTFPNNYNSIMNIILFYFINYDINYLKLIKERKQEEQIRNKPKHIMLNSANKILKCKHLWW